MDTLTSRSDFQHAHIQKHLHSSLEFVPCVLHLRDEVIEADGLFEAEVDGLFEADGLFYSHLCLRLTTHWL